MLVNCVDINGIPYTDINKIIYKSNIRDYKQYVDVNSIPYVSPEGLIYISKRPSAGGALKLWNAYVCVNGQFQVLRPYVGVKQPDGTIKFISADSYIASTIIRLLHDETLIDSDNNILLDNNSNIILK